MVTESDRIRADIQATRHELASDVDRLADRTNPKRIARRRWNGVKESVRSVRDKVMGVSESAYSTVSDAASDVGDTVREAPHRLARTAQGNPLAVGVIAFGGGMLAAALIPETDAERRLGHEIVDHSEQLVEPLREASREIGSGLGESVRDAADQVKETAQEAMSHTVEQAKESGESTVAEVRQTTPLR
jgi:gas vesicle protein